MTLGGTGIGTVEAPPFIKSLLCWQRAVAASAHPPCPCALFSTIDLAKATHDPPTAAEWADYLASVAGNFDNLFREAKVTAHDEIQKIRSLFRDLIEANQYAIDHVTRLGDSDQEISLAFVRSLQNWQSAMLAASAHPSSFGLIPGVDLERAAIERGGAMEWVEFLGSVAAKIVQIQIDALRLGCACPLTNAETMLSDVCFALGEAKNHAAAFSAPSTALGARGTSSTSATR